MNLGVVFGKLQKVFTVRKICKVHNVLKVCNVHKIQHLCELPGVRKVCNNIMLTMSTMCKIEVDDGK